jgi:hypothetical protein
MTVTHGARRPHLPSGNANVVLDIQRLWDAFATSMPRCPREAGPMAISIAEIPNGRIPHAYRFCCVGCGWATPLFTVVEGVASFC